jgi:hypothetical protein
VNTVHVLRDGWPLCQFSSELPGQWPTGHVWVRVDDWNQATCPKCRYWAQHSLGAVPGLDYLLPGDPRGHDWGYTLERWEGSYLVIDGDRIICSLLHARVEGAGYFRTLLQGIERSGYRAVVPVPMPNMRAILRHYGFVPHMEDDEVDVWERPRERADD